MMTTLHFRLGEVAPYIDWSYFFHAWQLPVRLAQVADVHACEGCRQQWLATLGDDAESGREAIRLYDDALNILRKCEGRFHAHARFALLEANSEGDDVLVFAEREVRIPFLRQQLPSDDGVCYCMSDFIRPLGDERDKIGLFACSVDEAMEHEEPENVYLHMLHQTLADRLAEATAERLHELVRTSIWGYAAGESLTKHELFCERYQGGRPAVGYPSVPDQSLTFVLDDLLTFGDIGIRLTESGAMQPHASTCGFMLSHPKARHFSVGRVGDDQLCDYARRRGMSVNELRRFIH